MPVYNDNYVMPKLDYCESCGNPLPPYMLRVCNYECFTDIRPTKTASGLQHDIYWLIVAHAAVFGYTPPLRLISESLYTSISNARHHMETLIRFGLLCIDDNKRVNVPGLQIVLPEYLANELPNKNNPFNHD